MKYSFNNLYFGIIKYYNKRDSKFDAHALYKDTETEELYDLDLRKPILPYGVDEKYYIKSLISFNEVMYTSRISWGYISFKDALRIKENYIKCYFRLLKCKNIITIDDLKEKEEHNTRKKKR